MDQSDDRIVYIGQNIPACSATLVLCILPTKLPVMFLELNSGYTAAHHWKVGDKLDLKGIF